MSMMLMLDRFVLSGIDPNDIDKLLIGEIIETSTNNLYINS